MRIVKRIPTAKEQADVQWRAQDNWTRELMREVARLGYDVRSIVPAEGEGPTAVRMYLENVGALALSLVLRIETDGHVSRVASGRRSMTARQAALWLHTRSPRPDAKKYL
jgi:hypothetical protein